MSWECKFLGGAYCVCHFSLFLPIAALGHCLTTGQIISLVSYILHTRDAALGRTGIYISDGLKILVTHYSKTPYFHVPLIFMSFGFALFSLI